MERILQENNALDSLIQRYLDDQNEVTKRTRTLYVYYYTFTLLLCQYFIILPYIV